jgi:4-amino-4-deoxychorismate lyase
MCRFFETICVQDGVIQRLSYHQKRVDDTRAFFYPTIAPISLESCIHIPDFAQKGTFRCRVNYDEIIHNISFFPYTLRTHQRIQLVEQPTFTYDFKWENRAFFSEQLAKYPDVDEILFTQNGFLTDTTYTHVLFRKEAGNWVLPETYLLPGTKCKYLLDNQLVDLGSLHINDLKDFTQIALINAMRDFEEVYSYTFDHFSMVLELKKIEN